MLDFTGNQGSANESNHEILFFTHKIGGKGKGLILSNEDKCVRETGPLLCSQPGILFIAFSGSNLGLFINNIHVSPWTSSPSEISSPGREGHTGQ